jgi:calcineurin-like phosphoesterase family protein
MSKVFVIADTHFGDENIRRFENRPFALLSTMNEKMIKNWNDTVSDEDTVYVLGDCCFGGPEYMDQNIELIRQMNGKKYLAIGNHDTDTKIKMYKEAGLFEAIQFAYRIRFKKYEYLMTHYPTLVWNGEDPKPVWNIHGHDHDKSIFHDTGHNYDVCMEAHNCYPVSLEQIHADIKAHKTSQY